MRLSRQGIDRRESEIQPCSTLERNLNIKYVVSLPCYLGVIRML